MDQYLNKDKTMNTAINTMKGLNSNSGLNTTKGLNSTTGINSMGGVNSATGTQYDQNNPMNYPPMGQ